MALTFASVIISCIVGYGIFYIIIRHLNRRRLYAMASKFDGPTPLPFIGSAHLTIGDTEHILSKLNETIGSYASPFRIWLGSHLFIVLHEPEQAKVVLHSPNAIEKGAVLADVSQAYTGAGLLSSPGSIWKVHRKLIQPTFNTKILNSFVQIFAAQSKVLIERMYKNLDGPEFGISEMLSAATLDMVCETVMGVKVGAQMDKNCYYVQAANQVPNAICQRMFNIFLYPDWIFYLTKMGRNMRKNIQFVHDFTDNVIQRKKEELAKCNGQAGTADEENDGNTKLIPRRQAFLDHIMKLRKENECLSDEELRDEIHTLMVAGTDSTAMADSYALMILASNPHIQEKVYEELYEIYGDGDIEEHPVTAEDLPRMKYLERVIKESLRLYPIGPFILREATENVQIGDHTIPKGCTICIGILNIHRNEKYWPDPLKFDPDRFLPEEISKRHPYAFLAFSGGPRNCIGINYAMMSMKTLIATVLRKYILKTDHVMSAEDIRLKLDIILQPIFPFTIKIERRTRKPAATLHPGINM